jgi:hypothetical protein
MRAIAKGVSYAPSPIGLDAGAITTRDIHRDARGTATVRGTVTGGGGAHVALFVASTYDPATGKGVLPAGFDVASGADGGFSIAGVPEGRYLVLASPGLDGLTPAAAPPIIDVAAGVDYQVPEIRLRSAVTLVGPGASGPELVSAAPTLAWHDRPEDDGYRITVVTSVGTTIWQDQIARQTSDPTVPYGGTLTAGTFYRFRVDALDLTGQVSATSEDLSGIFYVAPP